jgi:hypothetical protein
MKLFTSRGALASPAAVWLLVILGGNLLDESHSFPFSRIRSSTSIKSSLGTNSNKNVAGHHHSTTATTTSTTTTALNEQQTSAPSYYVYNNTSSYEAQYNRYNQQLSSNTNNNQQQQQSRNNNVNQEERSGRTRTRPSSSNGGSDYSPAYGVSTSYLNDLSTTNTNAKNNGQHDDDTSRSPVVGWPASMSRKPRPPAVEASTSVRGNGNTDYHKGSDRSLGDDNDTSQQYYNTKMSSVDQQQQQQQQQYSADEFRVSRSKIATESTTTSPSQRGNIDADNNFVKFAGDTNFADGAASPSTTRAQSSPLSPYGASGAAAPRGGERDVNDDLLQHHDQNHHDDGTHSSTQQPHPRQNQHQTPPWRRNAEIKSNENDNAASAANSENILHQRGLSYGDTTQGATGEVLGSTSGSDNNNKATMSSWLKDRLSNGSTNRPNVSSSASGTGEYEYETPRENKQQLPKESNTDEASISAPSSFSFKNVMKETIGSVFSPPASTGDKDEPPKDKFASFERENVPQPFPHSTSSRRPDEVEVNEDKVKVIVEESSSSQSPSRTTIAEEARARAEARMKARQARAEAQAKADAAAGVRAEARAKAEALAKRDEAETAAARAEAQAKSKADSDANAKAQTDARTRLEEQAKRAAARAAARAKDATRSELPLRSKPSNETAFALPAAAAFQESPPKAARAADSEALLKAEAEVQAHQGTHEQEQARVELQVTQEAQARAAAQAMFEAEVTGGTDTTGTATGSGSDDADSDDTFDRRNLMGAGTVSTGMDGSPSLEDVWDLAYGKESAASSRSSSTAADTPISAVTEQQAPPVPEPQQDSSKSTPAWSSKKPLDIWDLAYGKAGAEEASAGATQHFISNYGDGDGDASPRPSDTEISSLHTEIKDQLPTQSESQRQAYSPSAEERDDAEAAAWSSSVDDQLQTGTGAGGVSPKSSGGGGEPLEAEYQIAAAAGSKTPHPSASGMQAETIKARKASSSSVKDTKKKTLATKATTETLVRNESTTEHVIRSLQDIIIELQLQVSDLTLERDEAVELGEGIHKEREADSTKLNELESRYEALEKIMDDADTKHITLREEIEILELIVQEQEEQEQHSSSPQHQQALLDGGETKEAVDAQQAEHWKEQFQVMQDKCSRLEQLLEDAKGAALELEHDKEDLEQDMQQRLQVQRIVHSAEQIAVQHRVAQMSRGVAALQDKGLVLSKELTDSQKQKQKLKELMMGSQGGEHEHEDGPSKEQGEEPFHSRASHWLLTKAQQNHDHSITEWEEKLNEAHDDFLSAAADSAAVVTVAMKPTAKAAPKEKVTTETAKLVAEAGVVNTSLLNATNTNKTEMSAAVVTKPTKAKAAPKEKVTTETAKLVAEAGVVNTSLLNATNTRTTEMSAPSAGAGVGIVVDTIKTEVSAADSCQAANPKAAVEVATSKKTQKAGGDFLKLRQGASVAEPQQHQQERIKLVVTKDVVVQKNATDEKTPPPMQQGMAKTKFFAVKEFSLFANTASPSVESKLQKSPADTVKSVSTAKKQEQKSKMVEEISKTINIKSDASKSAANNKEDVIKHEAVKISSPSKKTSKNDNGNEGRNSKLVMAATFLRDFTKRVSHRGKVTDDEDTIKTLFELKQEAQELKKAVSHAVSEKIELANDEGVVNEEEEKKKKESEEQEISTARKQRRSMVIQPNNPMLDGNKRNGGAGTLDRVAGQARDLLSGDTRGVEDNSSIDAEANIPQFGQQRRAMLIQPNNPRVSHSVLPPAIVSPTRIPFTGETDGDADSNEAIPEAKRLILKPDSNTGL